MWFCTIYIHDVNPSDFLGKSVNVTVKYVNHTVWDIPRQRQVVPNPTFMYICWYVYLLGGEWLQSSG